MSEREQAWAAYMKARDQRELWFSVYRATFDAMVSYGETPDASHAKARDIANELFGELLPKEERP